MVELPDHTLIGPDGPIRLVDVFDGRSQLIVYNHMWSDGAEWQCGGCTGLTSQYVRLGALDNYDARFVIVTNGPIDEALAYKAKVGNTMDWYSSSESSFGADVGAPPGAGFAVNVFLRDGDTVYRTWHTDGRGTEQLSYTFALIDILPWGRQEEWQDSPDGWPQSPTYSKWLDSPDVARLYGPNVSGVSRRDEAVAQWSSADQRPEPLSRGVRRARQVEDASVAAHPRRVHGHRLDDVVGVRLRGQARGDRLRSAGARPHPGHVARDVVRAVRRRCRGVAARVEGRARGCDGLLAGRRGRAAARDPSPHARRQAGLDVRHLPQGRLVPVGAGGHRGPQRRQRSPARPSRRRSRSTRRTPRRSTPTSRR